ncbi:hypothetical protein PMALA_037040, partial [Plasmodium malariae]
MIECFNAIYEDDESLIDDDCFTNNGKLNKLNDFFFNRYLFINFKKIIFYISQKRCLSFKFLEQNKICEQVGGKKIKYRRREKNRKELYKTVMYATKRNINEAFFFNLDRGKENINNPYFNKYEYYVKIKNLQKKKREFYNPLQWRVMYKNAYIVGHINKSFFNNKIERKVRKLYLNIYILNEDVSTLLQNILRMKKNLFYTNYKVISLENWKALNLPFLIFLLKYNKKKLNKFQVILLIFNSHYEYNKWKSVKITCRQQQLYLFTYANDSKNCEKTKEHNFFFCLFWCTIFKKYISYIVEGVNILKDIKKGMLIRGYHFANAFLKINEFICILCCHNIQDQKIKKIKKEKCAFLHILKQIFFKRINSKKELKCKNLDKGKYDVYNVDMCLMIYKWNGSHNFYRWLD